MNGSLFTNDPEEEVQDQTATNLESSFCNRNNLKCNKWISCIIVSIGIHQII
ncbi:MAG TPA: hypothetical protein VNA18_00265 [Nitrososphaeraceae archaeon]|nr:hypothetical protein [Nitrososphaeraceae archaeon]